MICLRECFFALEKNIYSVLGWNVLELFLRCRWITVLSKSLIFLYIFYMVVPSHYWMGMLKFQLLLNCLFFHFCQSFSHLFGSGLLEAHVFMIIVPSWWINPFIIIKLITLPQVTFYVYFVWYVYCYYISLVIATCMVYTGSRNQIGLSAIVLFF